MKMTVALIFVEDTCEWLVWLEAVIWWEDDVDLGTRLRSRGSWYGNRNGEEASFRS